MVSAMTVQEIKVNECDLCGAEAPVEGGDVHTHHVGVDGQEVDVEVCLTCWSTVQDTLRELIENGRVAKAYRRPRRRRRP